MLLPEHVNPPLQFLKLLAHDVRWHLLSELARSDRRVGELVSLTNRPQNLVSYHLARLRDGGLVREHRSSADSRDVYYSLDLDTLAESYRRGGGVLHPALACPPGEAIAIGAAGSTQPARILFLCTHNSARSQMAEALARRALGETAVVASAGSRPSSVHPLAVRVMAERGIDLAGQRSKALAEVPDQPWDRVITVCDRMREVCPIFPQATLTAHWSVADPAAVSGSPDKQLAAFQDAAGDIERRVRHLHLVLLVADNPIT
jgi:ArsR family transcriptional regulator, arsenate/arsenite/antimonite-responsive transcriptional repressor / arsenate reductase (thioredoxin)